MCIYVGWHRVGETAPFFTDLGQIVCVSPVPLRAAESPGLWKEAGSCWGPSAALPLPTEGWGELLFLSVWFVSMELMRAPAFLPDLLRIK